MDDSNPAIDSKNNSNANPKPGPSSSSSSSIPVPPSNASMDSETSPEVGYNGDMREYCKSLENWLWRAYWQRECAVSAYFTALSSFYPLMYGPYPPGHPYHQNQSGNTNGAQSNGSFGIPNPSVPNINININANVGAGAQLPPGSAFNNNVGDAPNLNNNNVPPNQNVRQVLLRGIRRNGNQVTFDFKVAPIWKRLMAECIDFFILLIVKIFVTLSIVDNFDLIDLDSLDIDALQESGTLMDVAYSLTSELLLLELTHRIVVCFFEAYCIFKGGATPGKSLLGLRVLYCQQVYPVIVNAAGVGGVGGVGGDGFNNNNNINGNIMNMRGGGGGSRILVSPGSFLTFPRALGRSIIKNFSLAFFFPICFTIFHFENNRTLYDIAAKSIVVEIRQ